MKPSVILSIIVCCLIAGTILYLNQSKTPPASTPIAEASPAQTDAPSKKMVVTSQEQPVVSPDTNQPAQVPMATPASSEVKPHVSAKSAALNWAVDTLVSPSSTFQQKKAAWQQLRSANQLDDAIEALKQGMTNNPTSAVYPATLGQAELQKASILSAKGASVNELGMAGMQADAYFDAALKIDPANWDAQFSKAVAMSYWPPQLNKGDEVIQRLSSLIDQQETMPAQPQFAHTYAVLGDLYDKAGKTDYANATWQLGASKFPSDSTLQQKINKLASH